jgi:hypothetical protein
MTSLEKATYRIGSPKEHKTGTRNRTMIGINGKERKKIRKAKTKKAKEKAKAKERRKAKAKEKKITRTVGTTTTQETAGIIIMIGTKRQ